MKRLRLYLQIAFSEVLFFFKKRAGFMDLGIYVVIPGTVTHIDSSISEDGDFNFELKVDPGSGKWTMLGERSTNMPFTIGCEVMPKGRLNAPLAAAVDALREGQHVMVSGRWAFDGSHSDAYMAGKRSLFLEVLAGLFGRAPNPCGWTELHPITSLKVIS